MLLAIHSGPHAVRQRGSTNGDKDDITTHSTMRDGKTSKQHSGRPAEKAKPVGRIASNSSATSNWSTDAMRELTTLVTDEMLDASQIEDVRASPVRVDGKENISPAPSVLVPRYLSNNCAPLGSHNGPLRQTLAGVRADTPRPLTFRPIGGGSRVTPTAGQGATSTRASPAPTRATHSATQAGVMRSPPRAQLGKRALADRSPQSARTTPSASASTKRAKQGTPEIRDAFSSELSDAGSRAPSPEQTAASDGKRMSPAASLPEAHDDSPRRRAPSPAEDEQGYSDDNEDEGDGGEDDADDDDDDVAPAPQLRSATDHLAAHMIANIAETAQTRPAQGAARSFMFTEVPEEGFPAIDNLSPGWLFANQDHDQLAAWPALDGEKVVAVIFGHGALDYMLDPSLTSAVGLIEAAIGSYVGSSSVKVSPPIAINAPQALNRAPYGFLVYNLTTIEAQALLRDGCVSSPDISLLLFPLAIQIPRLILSFGGIPSRPDEDVRRMAVSCMRTEKHANVLLELLALTPDLTKRHSPRQVLNRIIKSSTVTSSLFLTKRAVPMPVYNLLMDIPTTSASVWIRWRDTLRGLRWTDNEMGAVRVRDLGEVRCDGCQSNTHYPWACPFPRISDWFGMGPDNSTRRGYESAARGGHFAGLGASFKFRRGGRRG